MRISLALIVLCLLLTACGGKSKSGGKTQVSTIFVQGDPISVVGGATFNKNSFLSSSNLAEFDQFQLVSISQFTEKQTIVEQADVDNIERGHEASTSDANSDELLTFSFKNVGGLTRFKTINGEIGLDFKETADKKLELKTLVAGNESVPLEVLHYSLKNDRSGMSFLVSTQTSEGRVILSLTFMKNGVQGVLEKTNTKYKYLMGPGLKINWDNRVELNVDICGSYSPKVEKYYRNGVEMWNPSLYGRLSVKTRTLTSYAPFSDLNTHCIYTVDNYLTMADPRLSNSGTTYITPDLKRGRLVDADIMIWVKENQKSGKKLDDMYSLTSTVAHEFGHLLGLDHQFDDSYPSIMSYDDISYITSYDKSAIQELYAPIPSFLGNIWNDPVDLLGKQEVLVPEASGGVSENFDL